MKDPSAQEITTFLTELRVGEKNITKYIFQHTDVVATFFILSIICVHYMFFRLPGAADQLNGHCQLELLCRRNRNPFKSVNSREKNIPNEKATSVHMYGGQAEEWHDYNGHSVSENTKSVYNGKV